MVTDLVSILAINPGSRYLGVAVLKGTELKEWKIKSIRGESIEEKIKSVESILTNLIDSFTPQIIVLKALHPSRSSRNLSQIVTTIVKIVQERKVKLHEYSLSHVKHVLLQKKRGNKKELAEFVVTRYPVLFHILNKEKQRKNVYYIRMFEAVGLIIAYFYHIEEQLSLNTR